MDSGVLAGVIAFVAPLALYVFVVGMFTKGIATWATGILRPLLLMLVFAPGIVVGHGVAIVPWRWFSAMTFCIRARGRCWARI